MSVREEHKASPPKAITGSPPHSQAIRSPGVAIEHAQPSAPCSRSKRSAAERRFIRSFFSILQNPARALSRILTEESPDTPAEAGKPTHSQACTVNHLAVRFAVALCRLIILREWLCSAEEAAITKSTRRFVSAYRKHHLHISASTLYDYLGKFARDGLRGLMPHFAGGRPLRIPAQDLALIRDLLRQEGITGLYRAARRHARLSGGPISARAVEQVVDDFAKHKKAGVKSGGRRGQRTRTSINQCDQKRSQEIGVCHASSRVAA
jgi:hypothetical protein